MVWCSQIVYIRPYTSNTTIVFYFVTECSNIAVLYSSAGFWGGEGPPTMFMCLAIRATCECHLVFFNEKNLFVDAIKIIGRPNSSISLEEYLILWRNNYYTYWFPGSRSGIWTWWMKGQATLNTLAYISTRFWKILRLLYSDLYRLRMSSIARYGYHTPSFWSTCPRFSWEWNILWGHLKMPSFLHSFFT